MVLDKGRHWFQVVREQPLFYSVAHSLSTGGPENQTHTEGGRGGGEERREGEGEGRKEGGRGRKGGRERGRGGKEGGRGRKGGRERGRGGNEGGRGGGEETRARECEGGR